MSADLNQLPWVLDNKLHGGQCGLGEILDKQLHAAVATWLSVFKFRSFNVDQSVYTSCSHTTESSIVSQSLWSCFTERSQQMQLPWLKWEAGCKNSYIPAEVYSPAELLVFSQLFPIFPHLAFPFAVNVIFVTIFLRLPWLKNAKENWFLYDTTLHISDVHHQKERKKTSRCTRCDPGLYLQEIQLSLHLQLLLISEFLT